MSKNEAIIDKINGICTIILTQGKSCIIDLEDYLLISQYKWYVVRNNYDWCVVTHEAKTHKNIRMHRFILNAKLDEEVDHINGNGLDNRKCNLRIVTRSQNNMNRRKWEKSPNRYKGVFWRNDVKKWRAVICLNYKDIHLGYFINELDAARAYNEGAIKYHGKYARLNIIEEVI